MIVRSGALDRVVAVGVTDQLPSALDRGQSDVGEIRGLELWPVGAGVPGLDPSGAAPVKPVTRYLRQRAGRCPRIRSREWRGESLYEPE